MVNFVVSASELGLQNNRLATIYWSLPVATDFGLHRKKVRLCWRVMGNSATSHSPRYRHQDQISCNGIIIYRGLLPHLHTHSQDFRSAFGCVVVLVTMPFCGGFADDVLPCQLCLLMTAQGVSSL